MSELRTTASYRWRTNQTSNEGRNGGWVYVDGEFGSNVLGDGTRAKPYQTIEQAYYGTQSKYGGYPSCIICRGPIYGTIIGNHSCALRGDYYGAAVYDDPNGLIMWMSDYNNLMIVNAGNKIVSPGIGVIYPNGYEGYKDAPYAGVGRAYAAGNVAVAGHVHGLASSPVLCHNAKLWRGTVGGIGSNTIFSHSKRLSANAGVVIGQYGNDPHARFTAYHCKWSEGDRENRRNNTSLQTVRAYWQQSIICQFDIFVDEGNASDVFKKCFFTADTNFIFTNTKDSKEYAIVLGDPEGEQGYTLYNDPSDPYEAANIDADTLANSTSAVKNDPTKRNLYKIVVDGCASIPAAIDYVRSLNTSDVASTGYKPQFSDCVFSNEIASDVFNNPEELDFTIKLDSGAILNKDTWDYCGALPPSMVAKFIGSTASASDASNAPTNPDYLRCFDNRTLSGALAVVDGELCLDDSSQSAEGSIKSKIIKIDPRVVQINGVYGYHMGHRRAGITMNEDSNFGGIYTSSNTLEIGTYLILSGGGINYVGVNGEPRQYNTGECIFVTASTPNSFTDVDNLDPATLVYIADPNIMDVLYVRCRATVYGRADQSENLRMGVTYYNDGAKTVSYNYRTILPGESFVADSNTQTFSTTDSDPDYTIGVMFDDRSANELRTYESDNNLVSGSEDYLVKDSSPWVPAQLWGNYWVYKKDGNITYDTTYGNPEGCGNYLNWSTAQSAVAQTYNSGAVTTVINQIYTQLAIFVNKVN